MPHKNLDSSLLIHNAHITAFKYDEDSLKRLTDVLVECRYLMDPGSSLVISLQSNNLQDIGGGYPNEWKNMIQKFQQELNNHHGFVCPLLDINFRNSSSIYASVNSIHKIQGNTSSEKVQNTIGIPKKVTTLESSPVRQITFNWLNGKQDDLNTAMSHLYSTLQKEIDPQKDPLIILYDGHWFPVDQVQKSLKSLKSNLNIYHYPSISDPDPEKEIDTFLKNSKGVLITTHSLFKGSEAENVVSLLCSDVTSSNVRGTLMRCVSRLYILLGLSADDRYKINNTINDNSLLYCFEKCRVQVWHCLDCSQQSNNQMMVFTSCTKTCHENHKFEGKFIQRYNLKSRCQCTSHHKK